MTREIELCFLVWGDATMIGPVVNITLPVSKADPQGRGYVRS